MAKNFKITESTKFRYFASNPKNKTNPLFGPSTVTNLTGQGPSVTTVYQLYAAFDHFLGYIDKGRISSKADAYKAGGFNQLVSDDIPMDRDVPESRLGGCPHQEIGYIKVLAVNFILE